jgi:hypothetical protein
LRIFGSPPTSKNHIVYVVLARKVFGREYMKVVAARVQGLLREWGYMRTGTAALVLRTIFEALLYRRCPHLDQLKIEDLKEVIARRPPRTGSYCIVALSRVLASMGTVPEAMEIKRPVKDKKLSPALTLGVPAEWCRLSRIWYDRATYSRKNRNKSYYFLLNVGRWLGKVHPEIISPADWTRELAAEAVSVICQWQAVQELRGGRRDVDCALILMGEDFLIELCGEIDDENTSSSSGQTALSITKTFIPPRRDDRSVARMALPFRHQL